jgi:hypothetical protein
MNISSRFRHLFQLCCTLSAFMNQNAQGDMNLDTDWLQLQSNNAPSVQL